MAEAWTSRAGGVRAVLERRPAAARSASTPTPACRAGRSAPGRSSGPATTSPTTRFKPHAASATRSSAESGSTRSSRRRSSTATWSSARSRSTATGADAFDDDGRRAPGRRSPTRPPSRSRTPASSTSSSGRARRSPGGPTPSGRCARSRPASRPSATRPRSSSRSSTRRPGCSTRTAPGSTCTTRRSTPCAGRTPRATRCPGHPRLGQDRRSQAGRGRRRHGLRRAAPGPDRRLPRRRPLRPDDGAAAFVDDAGIRSVIAVPLTGEAGPLGTLSVVSRQAGRLRRGRRRGADGPRDQAAIAIPNARLIEELDRSRADIARRAEAEQALREIAARITAIREPGDLLQHVVDEARAAARRRRRDHRPVRPGRRACWSRPTTPG